VGRSTQESRPHYTRANNDRQLSKGENDGQEFDYTTRFMSICVKHENEWKMVAEQSTPIE
jgi:hypothetical protein